MPHGSNAAIAAMVLAAATAAYAAPPVAAGSGEKPEFQLQDTHTAKDAHGATASKIVPTRTEAAMKLFVVDKDKGPVKGVVIFLTGPDKTKYYAEPTDAEGYAEVLVPVGRNTTSPTESRPAGDRGHGSRGGRTESIRQADPALQARAPRQPFILAGVNFDTAKATIRPESFPHLDGVVDFMVHKKSARVEISGHTDNVGNAKANKTLSEKRAQACRDYIVSKGIDKKRLDAVGFGDEHPIAPNDTDEGRQKNRRIEAKEL